MSEDRRQYSSSYEKNKEPIFEVINGLELPAGAVLEVGSGSGQHVCDFASRWMEQGRGERPWHPTEQLENLESIEAWRQSLKLADIVHAPCAIDLLEESWHERECVRRGAPYALAMSVNVAHIVAWRGVEHLLKGVGSLLVPDGVLYLYGPYRSRGRDLEPSNARFDEWLEETFEGGGLRISEEVEEVALTHGMVLEEDRAMPANNRSLIFRKRESR